MDPSDQERINELFDLRDKNFELIKKKKTQLDRDLEELHQENCDAMAEIIYLNRKNRNGSEDQMAAQE